MLAVQTKRTLSGPCSAARSTALLVSSTSIAGASSRAGRGSRPRASASRTSSRASSIVRPVVSTRTSASLGLLVGRGDAGELGDLAAPGLGVEALAVAALALLERGGDVHEEERAAGVARPSPAPAAGSRRTARSGCRPRRPPCREISAATQPIRRMLVSRSSLEKVRPAERLRRTTSPSRLVTRALALLEQPVHQRPGERRLAAAGEAGEEEDQALLVGRGPVVRRRWRRSSRRAAAPSRRPAPSDRVGAGVVGDHLEAERVVGLGVAVRGERTATTRGVGQQARPRPAWRGSGATGERAGVPWPTSASSSDRAEAARASASSASVRASATGTKVRPAYCSRTCGGER